MKRFFVCLILLVGFATTGMASYFDTGWKKFKQPNGTVFIGRHGEMNTNTNFKRRKDCHLIKILEMDIIIMPWG